MSLESAMGQCYGRITIIRMGVVGAGWARLHKRREIKGEIENITTKQRAGSRRVDDHRREKVGRLREGRDPGA